MPTTLSTETKPTTSVPTLPKSSLVKMVETIAAIKASPAYAEVLLRKTELEATLDELTPDFTEEYPKIKEARFEASLIRRELDRIMTVTDASKLSLALGKLIVRKAALETDLWALSQRYGESHADVKRATRKVATFERAIKEILP